MCRRHSSASASHLGGHTWTGEPTPRRRRRRRSLTPPSPAQTSPGGLRDVPQVSELSGVGEAHLGEQREGRKRRRERQKRRKEEGKKKRGKGKRRQGRWPRREKEEEKEVFHAIHYPGAPLSGALPTPLDSWGRSRFLGGHHPIFHVPPLLWAISPTWCCLLRAAASCRKVLATSGAIGTPRAGPSSNSAPSRGTSGT